MKPRTVISALLHTFLLKTMNVLSRLPLLLCVLALHMVLIGCALSNDKARFTVKHNSNEVVGDLNLPSGKGPHPLIIFNHGDGAMPADVYGYYDPLMAAFDRAGFATFSWDKPGVGDSSGNWLMQSMQDRADEVIAITQALKKHPDIDGEHVGLWGISQAGWVMPLASTQASDYMFMISVSPAINFGRQGRFLTGTRMRSEGFDESDIEQALLFGETIDALLIGDASYEDYLNAMDDAPPCCDGIMDKARWHFVRVNLKADSSAGLRNTRIPVLVQFGDMDLNINYKESAKVYAQQLMQASNEDVTIKIYKNADHSMFPANKPRLSGTSLKAAWLTFKIELFGSDAFAEGYVDDTVEWAVERYQNHKTQAL